MRIAALVAVVALAVVSAAGASRGGPERIHPPKAHSSNGDRATIKQSGCPYARLGVVYYRNRYVQWQLQRGAGVPTWRQPRNCADARYLANVWAKRSRDARDKTRKYREAMERREHQHPKWIALRLLDNDRAQWNCLMSITWVENRTMDPTLDYGGGHGNVYEAYGIPQATPGTKMASAGPDWRTNPETQLKWMIAYCRSRYGSVCGAAYHRSAYGTY